MSDKDLYREVRYLKFYYKKYIIITPLPNIYIKEIVVISINIGRNGDEHR